MPLDSPMMRQYNKMKLACSDALLFFRLGDFYEMFGEDAITASRELNLTLTTRDRSIDNPDERVPMCGVPHHSSEGYIARLIAKGYKVAICEQMEDPAAAKGLVDRDIIRVVAPGTITEPNMLDEDKPNYLMSIAKSGDTITFAKCDISTGEASLGQCAASNIGILESEIASGMPREIIINSDLSMDPKLFNMLKTVLPGAVSVKDELFLPDDENDISVCALTNYIAETRMTDCRLRFTAQAESDYMRLDPGTIRNLEIVAGITTGERRGSLLWAVDKTKTPMGKRLIRSWLLRPLTQPAGITRRLEAVNELFSAQVTRGEIIHILKSIGDIERISGKIYCGSGNTRDIQALGQFAAALPGIINLCGSLKSSMLRDIARLDPLSDLLSEIEKTIADEPPVTIRDGGIIRAGFSAEVDRLRALVEGGGGQLIALETREREQTGLKVKIGYNRVFGYYIETPRSQASNAPARYNRLQTLANSERYTTSELKELETDILSAREKSAELEYDIFVNLCGIITEARERIAQTAARVAKLDVLASFAEAAVVNNYVMPDIEAGDILDIKEGRHPVVELMQQGSRFIPNDTQLGGTERTALIITGPNMAGKSTYMRQTALIVLLAQAGSFVPAKSARIGIADGIFTRIGAGDDISGGKSTFMVEMSEASEILKRATRRSLIILDEIGRGTSTYDGVAIARAILEYCADKRKLGAKTMLSTHYHELAEAEESVQGVVCCAMTARRHGGEVVFLRKVTPGAIKDSYGIDVAKIAGLPESVIRRARQVMEELSSKPQLPDANKAQPPEQSRQAIHQLMLSSGGESRAAEKLRNTDPDTLSPIEALNLVYDLIKEVNS